MKREEREAQVRKQRMRLIIGAAAVILVIIIAVSIRSCSGKSEDKEAAGTAQENAAQQDDAQQPDGEAEQENAEAQTPFGKASSAVLGLDTEIREAMEKAAADGTDPEVTSFSPAPTEDTKPENYIEFTDIQVNGEVLESNSDYSPWYDFHFGVGSDYTDLEGIVTFRGNNFRNTSAYGSVDISEGKIEEIWTKSTGTMESNGKVWSGNGWTGQPLMMKWPSDVKAHMNMTEEAKAKDDLVEVIYAGMDGNIYFMDLETGEETRDPMYLGFTFKGAGALDPRGYPILYVGAGYNSDEGVARVFVINLLDCSVMYTFGNEDSFSLRGSLSFFDASALVDAESDTLIYPGENGILYLIKLNTNYDAAAGTLSIDPDQFVKWRYNGYRNSSENFWWGMEDSPAVYDHYMFIADNGGHLMCLDLQTLKLVWVQDILDDSNGTPALSVEDGKLYLYISTSFHLGWRSSDTATVPIWKIDAESGEIVWQTDYTCYSEDGVSGGVQSSAGPGKNSLSDYVYVTVSRTGDSYSGVLVCLDKSTGEKVWEHKAVYAWSSPLVIDRGSGDGKVLYATAGGKMYLLDGKTGDTLDTFDFGEQTIEATPALYDDHLVIGTRDCQICGFKLK